MATAKKSESAIIWEAPPESGANGGVHTPFWAEFVEELKKRPGEWACAPREYKNVGSAGNSSSLFKRCFPGVESVARGTKVYARWMGKAGDR